MSKQVFLVLKPLGGVNIYFLFKLIFVVIATISMETLFYSASGTIVLFIVFQFYSFYGISIYSTIVFYSTANALCIADFWNGGTD